MKLLALAAPPSTAPLSTELLAHLAGLAAAGQELAVSIQQGNVTVSLTVNVESALPVPPVQADTLTDSETDILALLEAAGRRMTMEQVKDQLQQAGKLHGDSTITKALPRLVHRKRLLTNGKDGRGKGYGLAGWG